MKNLPLNSLKNKFLSPESQEIQKLAYYGKFLVLPEFDDGWKYQMQKQLLDYLASLDFSEDSEIDLQVETQDTKQEIFAILKAEKLNKQTEEQIEEITKKLQVEFFMTEFNQRFGFGKSKDSQLPLTIAELKEEDFGYERFVFQKQYAEILKVKQKLEDINHYINSKNVAEDDEVSKALINSLMTYKQVEQERLDQLESQLSSLNEDLYDKSALKEILQEQKSFVLVQENKNKALVNGTESSDDNSKEESKLDLFEYSKGIIGECNLDKDGYIISAKNILTGESIYYDSKTKKTIGFKIKGLENINYIRPIEFNEEKQAVLIKVYIGETNYHYYFENGEYKRLEIGDYYANLSFTYYCPKNTGKPLYGHLKFGGYRKKLYWIEDGEYRLFEYKDKKTEDFYNLVRDETGKPLHGFFDYKGGGGRKIVFWLEDGEYKFLEKILGKEIIKIKELVRNENGKPLYGTIIYNGIGIDGERTMKFLLDPETGEYRKKKMFEKIPEEYLQYAKK